MCEKVKNAMERLWNKVLDVCPEQMQIEMGRMTVQARAELAINALNSKFITAWFDICIMFPSHLKCIL